MPVAKTDMDGMDSSLYGEQPMQEGGKAEEGKESIDEEAQEQAGTIVPLSVLTGKEGPPKVGDEIVVKVVALHGDEAEIVYAPEKPGGETETKPGMGANEELESLNTQY